MGGNRKHGFMRGNGGGQSLKDRFPPWHCDGCGRKHGGQIDRWGTLDGKSYCGRQYDKLKADAPVIVEEATEAGMQYLIPGCEVAPEPGSKQGKLF